MKFWLLIAIAGIILFSAGACEKKEEPKPEIPVDPVQLLRDKGDVKSEQQSSGTDVSKAKQDFHGEKPEIRVIVPENVKKKWDSVKLSIEDRKLRKTDTVIVKLGEEYVIPGSELKINVGDFLPDFRMDALAITSPSNKPNNPAVKVIISSKDKEIFNGWLYSKFPTVHSFQHDRFGILLKEGVQKR